MKLPGVLLAALLPWSSALAIDLSVDLRTDFVAGADFRFARVEMEKTSSPAQAFPAAERFVGSDEDLLAGIRIADFAALPVGEYEAVVLLLNDDLETVASRNTEFVANSDFSFTTTVVKPDVVPPTALNKIVELFDDADGDGQISTGDTLRYHVFLVGPSMSGRFEDTPGVGGRLVAGSVRANPHGTVVLGNGANDRSLAVEVVALEEGDATNISFEVRVEPIAANQGVVSLVEFNPDSILSARLRSDDPDTPFPGDPTVNPVDNSALQCVLLASQLADELAMLEEDGDGDGRPDIVDACSTTPAGSAVDRQGCSQAEYCGAIDVSTPGGVETCNHSDWQNDEPRLENPKDCKATGSLCAVRN